MPNKKRLLWVDYAKGISILLIVFLHVFSGVYNADIGLSTTFFTLARDIISSFATPVFLFLSGLFTEQSFTKRGFRPFLTEKIKALIYPYIIWTLIMGGFQILFSHYTNTQTSIRNLLNFWYLPLGHLWFLYTLTIFYIIYAIAQKLSPKNALGFLSVLALLLFFFPIHSLIFTLEDISSRMLFFVLGILYQKYLLKKDFASPASTILSISLFMSVAFYTLTQISGYYESPRIMALTLALLGILTTTQLSRILAQKGFANWLVSTGKYSLPIYLAHPVFASGTRIVLDKLMGYQNPVIHILVGLLIGILAPIWLYRLSKRLNFPYLFSLRPLT